MKGAKDIKQAIASNDRFAVNCMLKIYEYQTDYEQTVGTTTEWNGVGFNGADAEILSSFVKQVQSWDQSKYPSPLSPKQMAIVQKKVGKYAKQLEPLLTDDDFNVSPYPTSNGTIQKDSITGKVTYVGEIREYQYGPRFYITIDNNDGSELKCMVDVNSIADPQREIPSVGETVSATGTIKGSWMNIKLSDTFELVNPAFELIDGDRKEHLDALFEHIEKLRPKITYDSYSNVMKAIDDIEFIPKKEIKNKHQKSLSDLVEGF